MASCKITRVESADGTAQTLTPEMEEEPVKVKYGADDNEVYAEIVATRLMWALGYPAGQLMETRFVSLIHPDDLKKTMDAADELRRGAVYFGLENRYRHADGSWRWRHGCGALGLNSGFKYLI